MKKFYLILIIVLFSSCEKYNLAIVGDSITERHEWTEFSDNYNVNVFGYSGYGTVKIIEQLDTIKESNPDILILLIGINDIRNPYIITTIEESLDNYKYIIEELKDIEVHCISILPVEDLGFDYNSDVEYYNTEIKDICKNYIEVHDYFMKDYETNLELLVDDVHPNAAGYKVLTDIYKRYI